MPAPDLNAPSLGAGSISGFAAVGAGIAATAITTPIVVHALGPAMFGTWVALIAAISFTGLLDFGFSFTVARFVGEHRARRDGSALNDFIITMAGIYAVVFVLVIVVALIIGLELPGVVKLPPASHGSLTAAAFLIGLATALGLWVGFLTSILHAHQRLPLANMTRILYWALFTLLTVGAALSGRGINALAAALSVSALVTCAVQLIMVRRLLPIQRLRMPQTRFVRQALSYSGFMFLISAGGVVIFETDTLVIASFIGVAAVTAYAIALRVTRALTGVVHKVPDVLFPFYAGMRAVGDVRRIRASFLLTTRLELAGALMIVLGLAFAGRTLVAAWVGVANVASQSVFALALTMVVLEAVVHPAAVLLAATGGERRMALVNALEAIINLGLSIALALRFGVAGVIGATVIALALTNLWWLPRLAIRSLDMTWAVYARTSLWPNTLPLLAGGAAGLLVTLLMPWSAAPLVAAAAALSAFAAVYLGSSAGLEERRWVRGRLRQGDRAA